MNDLLINLGDTSKEEPSIIDVAEGEGEEIQEAIKEDLKKEDGKQ